MPLNPVEEALLQGNTQFNRVTFPPMQIAGLGQPQLAIIPSVFGGLTSTAGHQQVITGTPERFTGWDTARPDIILDGAAYEGLFPDVDDNEIDFVHDGVYMVVIRVTGQTDVTGAEYSFHVYINGVDSGIVYTIDLSQQSDDFSEQIVTPLVMEDQGAIQLYIDGTASTITFESCEMFTYLIR